MKTFKNVNMTVKKVDEIFCNMCGEKIIKNGDGYFNDYLHVEKQWGYHSSKDMKIDSFDLCESCYDKIIKSFKIKPSHKENNK